ncbi:hypothetical protein CAL7716_042110 [Calothrix sp. PCC 7716]|nr:hypothetical protein CAL7716_042110 [Calothrix sp. PCC 7716]
MERGHKTLCAKVLSCLLGVSMSTIRCGWGTLDFETMPEYYKLVLGYISTAKIDLLHASNIKSGAYKPETIEAQEFIEYALSLSNLFGDERDIRLSKNGFFHECARALASSTGFDYKTVVLWGNDIRFHKMPREHRRTLYYAKLAIQTSMSQQPKQLVAA